jgi:uncharacterized protein (TIGR03083 family)
VKISADRPARRRGQEEDLMRTLEHDRPITAAERGARQFCELLASADRPDAPAVGAWRVRDVGAHLTGVTAYTAMLRGVPSPARSIDGIATWNASNVTAANRLDCTTLAARVDDAYAGFLAEARRHPAEEAVGWHAGLKLPVATLCAILAGEAYIHGWDIARALRRPWPLDPHDMRTIFLGLLPVLPTTSTPSAPPRSPPPSTSACAVTPPPTPSSRSTTDAWPSSRPRGSGPTAASPPTPRPTRWSPTSGRARWPPP